MTLKNLHYSFLAKNVSWLMLGRIISKVISIGALPIITIYLAPRAFGIIALFIVEASFLAGLYGLGLNAFAGRMIYKYDRRNEQKCRQYLGITLFYLTIFSTIGLCISIPFARIVKGLILKDVIFPYAFLFYVPLIYAFFENIYGFATNSFLNFQLSKKFFICNTAEILLLIPIQIVGLVWFGFGWVEVVILQLAVKIIVTVLALCLIRDKLGFSFKRLKVIKHALRYSLPYVPLNFSSWIQQQIDKIFLGRMQAMSYVGVYAVGAKVGNALSFFSRPVATIIKPEISKRLDARKSNIQGDITDFFNLFFQFSLFLIFTVSIFSREIIALLTNVKYMSAFKIIPFIMLAYMFSELTGIFNLKYVYKNKTGFFPIVIFLGAFLNTVLNYYLIPRFDIVGAAFATASANLIVLFVSYFISQRLHISQYDMKKNFCVLILIVFLIFLIQHLLPHLMIMVGLKFGIIVFYSIILYKYLMHTNRRFKGVRDTLMGIIKLKFA